MTSDRDELLVPAEWSEIVRRVRARTPARLLAGRAGAAYRTDTQLELREAHAAARDAVRSELNLETTFDADFVKQWGLFEVCTQAASKDVFLLQPELGRHFGDAARDRLQQHCSSGNDLQIAIGDGLSVSAVATQVPTLMPLLHAEARDRGWTVGQTFVIRHCRVGILNEIGELLSPRVAVLLIGERPGLATSESLSAYMAYQPRPGHTDADRNLISSIHLRGTSLHDAAMRILNLAAQMMQTGVSGHTLKENSVKIIGK
jgi:ethanolamine ammonia-lyase small subunit